MQGEHKLPAGSSIEHLRLPRPYTWAALAILLLVLALFVFVMRAQPTIVSRPSTNTRWIHEFLSRQGSLQLIVAAALTIFGLIAFRRFMFARLARKPGPIEILPFVAGHGTEAHVDDILAHFRRTLRDVNLSPPMSMPGEPVSQGFLQVWRTATNEATGTVGAVIGMLAPLQVNHSYQVSGVIRHRSKNPNFGLTVQVVTLPSNTGSVETHWAEDWFEAAERGAHFVGAYVLPRSRISARPPWIAWRGLPVPYELFHRYQVAQSLLHKERYEEALDALHSALYKDPQNPYLRIQIVQLREQLGQQLDAVSGYADLLEIQAWQDRRVWKRLRRRGSDPVPGQRPKIRREPFGWTFGHPGSRRKDREALLVGRYRLVSALVRGSRLAKQWQESDFVHNPRRSRERGTLLERVGEWLTPYYKEFRKAYESLGLPEEFEKFVTQHLELLPLLFQYVALSETEDLIKDYSWIRGRRLPNMPIPQSALRVLEIWARLHLIVAESLIFGQAEFGTKQAAVRIDNKKVKKLWKELDIHNANSSWHNANSSWPPDPEVIERLLRRALRWKIKAFQGWQEHYNAASTFAVILLHPGIDPERAERVASKAVRHLERAVLTTGSGFAAHYEKWLAFGDQDLNRLRGTRSFVDFFDRYFPHFELREPKPENMLEQMLRVYVTGLVRQYAVLRAEFWADCARNPANPLAAAELKREREVAIIVRNYCHDYWSWQVRLPLIKEAHRFTQKHTSPFDFRLPSVDNLETSYELARSGDEQWTRRWERVASGLNLLVKQGLLDTSDPASDDGRTPESRVVQMRSLSCVWRSVDDALAGAAMGKRETNVRKVVAEMKQAGTRIRSRTARRTEPDAAKVCTDPPADGTGSRVPQRHTSPSGK